MLNYTRHWKLRKIRYADEISAARKAVLTVEGKSLITDLQGQEKSFDEFWEEADYVVIEDAYRRAGRTLSPDLCRTFAEHLASKNSDADSDEEALMEAHADIAALGMVPEIKEYLEAEADKSCKDMVRGISGTHQGFIG